MLSQSITDYLRCLRTRLRYPNAQIQSGRIAKTAKLGVGCKILRNVVVGPNVTIGNYSYVNEDSIVISGSVGNFSSIGYCCHIGLEEHPKQYLSTSPFTYAQHGLFRTPSRWREVYAPPEIGSDVWIGSRAIVLQGVSVGHGSVVAAGAVVTKSVRPYKIVAGVPAREIGERFEQPISDLLLRWKWWDLPPEELRCYKDLLTSTPSIGDLTRAVAERR